MYLVDRAPRLDPWRWGWTQYFWLAVRASRLTPTGNPLYRGIKGINLPKISKVWPSEPCVMFEDQNCLNLRILSPCGGSIGSCSAIIGVWELMRTWVHKLSQLRAKVMRSPGMISLRFISLVATLEWRRIFSACNSDWLGEIIGWSEHLGVWESTALPLLFLIKTILTLKIKKKHRLSTCKTTWWKF